MIKEMSINGIGYYRYQNNTAVNGYHKTREDFYSPREDAKEQTNIAKSAQNTNVQDIYERYRTGGFCDTEREAEEEEEKKSYSDEQKTDTEIIVKPDGSKIMMTTVRVGGMETVMSMEIAKPTNILAENTHGAIDNPNMMVSDTNSATESVPKK